MKLRNLFNICSRGIIQSVVEGFELDNLRINRKLRKFSNFSDPKGDKKIKVFPQGTYMAQNFIPKTSTILYSITKGISRIYQLERE